MVTSRGGGAVLLVDPLVVQVRDRAAGPGAIVALAGEVRARIGAEGHVGRVRLRIRVFVGLPGRGGAVRRGQLTVRGAVLIGREPGRLPNRRGRRWHAGVGVSKSGVSDCGAVGTREPLTSRIDCCIRGGSGP